MPSVDARPDGGGAVLPQGRLSGHREFQDVIRMALTSAAHQGWNELILCDADFADWPLGERSVIEALQAWAKSGRHMRLLAWDYRPLASLHPRFVQWRGMWGHLLDCRRVRGSDAASCPSMLWASAWAMHRIDAERDVLVCDTQASHCQHLRLILDECYRNSTPGFPASTLGL
jgi:hypothetical protein